MSPDAPLEQSEDRRQLELHVTELQRMQLVGQVAAGIAHDFRNLLTVILGSGEMLRESAPPGDPAHAEIDAILDAGARATALTGQLLGFSRRGTRVASDVSASAVVGGMANLLARMVGEDTALTIDAPDTGLVRADPHQIEQVLLNFVVNARDAMPRGGELRIETRAVTLPGDPGAPVTLAPGQYCRLRVADTGSGMSPETLSEACAFQFTTKRGRGTGIGLATCDRLARDLGGAIALSSALGAGTTATLYLPLIGTSAAPAAECGAAHPHPRGTETVLIVEDDDIVRTLLGRTLQGLGYHVHLAARGAEALALYDTHGADIDAVLCDVVMPDISGPETVSRILERAGRAPAVIFMSGHTDHALLSDGRLQCTRHFLQKPLARAAIARALRDALDVLAGRPE